MLKSSLFNIFGRNVIVVILWERFINPTTRYSDGLLVRQPVIPTTNYSDNPLFQQVEIFKEKEVTYTFHFKKNV